MRSSEDRLAAGAIPSGRSRIGLGLRIAAPISMLVAVVLGVHVYLNDPRELIATQKAHEVDRLGSIVRSIVAMEMMAGEPWRVQRHLGLIDCGEDVESVRIFGEDGVLRFGLQCEEQIGVVLDPMAEEACRPCHALTGEIPVGRLWKRSDGEEFYSRMLWLENEERCRNCHADDGDRLAKVLIDLRITEADHRELGSQRRLATTGAVLVLLAMLGIGGITHFFVTRPVQGLVRVADEVESGNFHPVFPPDRGDELGELTRALRHMADRLGHLVEHQDALIVERTEELHRSQQQVIHQEKMAGLGRLTAGVAHEIGNPLAALSALAQLIERTTREEETRESAREIGVQVQRMNRIVRELSELYRPRIGESRCTDFGDCLRTALRTVQFDRGFRGIETRIEVEPALPKMAISQDHLLQVLLNLLFNAADAMEEGGVLTVRAQRRDGKVSVRVEDTGCGIAEEDIEKVFDPFYTTKPPGKGTGLGLWVSYSLVQEAGGVLELQSRLGEGTTATLELPAAREG